MTRYHLCCTTKWDEALDLSCEGWELKSVCEDYDNNLTSYYFQRPIQELEVTAEEN